MARRSIPWRDPSPHILSTPESTRIVECYGMQGKGEHHAPFANWPCELILVNAARDVMIVPGRTEESWSLRTDAVVRGSGWRVLGWRMLDGSLPHGELDRVDSDLADLDKLPEPNKLCNLAASICCHPEGSPFHLR